MSEHILVVGASLLDVKGKPTAGLEPGTSNPARIRSTRGGTARNVAENLARLGGDVVLVSAVGDDAAGQSVMADTAAAGVDISHVRIIQGASTGGYMALLEADGQLSVALDDTTVMETISPLYLEENRRLFEQAVMVMVDGGVTPMALKKVIDLALEYDLPICADPSSSRLAHKIVPYLSHFKLVVPNEVEAAEICGIEYLGYDPDTSLDMARQLNERGVDHAVITLSDFGLVYSTGEESGYLPAKYSEMADSTGTGDAVSAAIIFGMLNDLDTIECMRLGASAASLTLQTNETVVPDLSLDMLYDHLL